MKAKKLPYLTELRFFAALYVIFFHSAGLFTFLPQPAFLFLHHGYSAVSFFFVLSGFIIYYTYSAINPADRSIVLNYRIARFARIYPAYITALVLSCVAGFYLYLSLGNYTNIVTDIIVFVLSIFMLQGFMAHSLDSGLNFNKPGWSLSSELAFYIGFPWILRLVNKVASARGIIMWIVVMWLLSLVAPAIYDYYFTGDALFTGSLRKQVPAEQREAYLFLRAFPLFHIPQFIVGVLFAKLYMNFDLEARKKTVLLCGLISFICAMLILCTDIFSSELINNGLLSLFFGSMILSFLFMSEKLIPFRPFMEQLGIVSYSMYIFAVPVEQLFHIALNKVGMHMNIWLFFAYVIIVVLVSFGFHRFDSVFRGILVRRLTISPSYRVRLSSVLKKW
jgi:peptidoglycan/LPS O-acetylase OafA/YrhL